MKDSSLTPKIFKVLLFCVASAFLLIGCAQQTPSATSEAVQLETLSGTLYGTLELPAGEEPFTAALIHPGSGATDRNGNGAPGVLETDAYKLLAEVLAQNGIASLRIDKRGVGESAGALTSEESLRFNTYVEDAAAWLGWLERDPRFDTIAIVGHSEGALVGLLAAKQTDADLYVSVAGAGKSAGDILRQQLSQQLPAELMQGVETVLTSLEAGETVDPLPESISSVPALANLFRPSVQPYLISWFQYDPTQEISTLDIPALIVQGTTDIQVSEEDAQALKAAQPEAELVMVERMNHVLKSAPADPAANQATYTDPDLPLAGGLVEPLVTFLQEGEDSSQTTQASENNSTEVTSPKSDAAGEP